MARETENKQAVNEQLALNLAPTFANRVRITVIGQFTRIAFGEFYQGTKEVFHTAVVVPTEAASGFANMIPRLIEENQKANQPVEGQTSDQD